MSVYNKGKKDFIDSLTSFDVIDDDKIREIIEFIGTDGYNSDDEETFDDFKEKIEYYKKMPNPIRLYRVVGAVNIEDIDRDKPGEHYTPELSDIDGDMLLSIGFDVWDSDMKSFVVVVDAPHSEIDVLQTMVQNLSFPREYEINLKDKGSGAEIVDIYEMPD